MNPLDEYSLLKFAKQRQRELVAEAGRTRLARQAGPHLVRPWLFFGRWLAGLGTLLLSWGCRLQTRYEPRFPVLAGTEPLPCRD